MDKDRLGLASKLLIKAQATGFDAEAAALTERAYQLLAEVLNAHDAQALAAGVARRRERRHLDDRRAHLRDQRPTSEPRPPSGWHETTRSTAGRSRRGSWKNELPARGHIDLRA